MTKISFLLIPRRALGQLHIGYLKIALQVPADIGFSHSSVNCCDKKATTDMFQTSCLQKELNKLIRTV